MNAHNRPAGAIYGLSSADYHGDKLAPRPSLSIDMLHRLLICDPDAGTLTWRARTPDLFSKVGGVTQRATDGWNTKFAGGLALNSIGGHGYRRGAIFNQGYLLHRVLFAMVSGHWPLAEIDHRNGDRLDNRLCNLREASRQQNMSNIGKRRHRGRQFFGVRQISAKSWAADIRHENEVIYLGTFPTEEAAARARDAAAVEMRGEFARLNFPLESPHG